MMTKVESFFNYPQCISRGLKTTNDKFWRQTQCFGIHESGKVIGDNVLRSRNEVNLGSDGGRNGEINQLYVGFAQSDENMSTELVLSEYMAIQSQPYLALRWNAKQITRAS